MILFPSKKYKLQLCFDDYFVYLKAEAFLADSSIKKYEEIAGNIIKMFGKELDVRRVNNKKIWELKESLNERGLSETRKNHHLVVIRNLLKFLQKEKGLNVMSYKKITKFKVRRKPVEYLTEEEITELIDSINTKTFSGKRLKALILSLLSTGSRISALVSLNIEDIDKEEVAQVRIKGGKIDSIIFSRKAMIAIEEYVRERRKRGDKTNYLFSTFGKNPKRWNPKDINRCFKGFAKKVGFKKRFYPHLLRKTAANLLYKKGASLSVVQKFLTHSSPSVTQNFYLGDISFEEVKRMHRKVF